MTSLCKSLWNKTLKRKNNYKLTLDIFKKPLSLKFTQPDASSITSWWQFCPNDTRVASLKWVQFETPRYFSDLQLVDIAISPSSDTFYLEVKMIYDESLNQIE